MQGRDGSLYFAERSYVQLYEQSGQLALRLSPDQREVFLKKYNAKLCEAYGVVQPEYVEVPASLLSSTRE
jgi:hypothetical protein